MLTCRSKGPPNQRHLGRRTPFLPPSREHNNCHPLHSFCMLEQSLFAVEIAHIAKRQQSGRRFQPGLADY